jgi:chromosome partitioning protein
VIIDCGPSLNLLNQNALSYADEVIIPVTCDYLALVGVKQVLRTIKDVERHLGHAVRVSAVLPTFYDGRTRLAREVLETLQGHFKHKCLEPIRHNTRLAEAPSHKKTIFEYAPASHGAKDYSRVCDWVLTMTSQGEATLVPDSSPGTGPDHAPPGPRRPSPAPRPRPDLARPEVLEVP